jgi:hypothetical protein
MVGAFNVARLIPVSGISNNTEAETRATSALLSVLTAVRDLSLPLTSPLGASAARKAVVEAFIETRFKLASGAVVRPDGLLHVGFGSTTWKALVEVKTGSDQLDPEQINNYLCVAREQGIDAVITISNEIGVGHQHPCEGVRLRANSRVVLAHYSWTEILAHAVRAKVHRGVADREQAWILGELIRYLEHPASGALAFDDMGANWVFVRDAAREGTLHKSSPEAKDIAQRWDQLVRFAALRLGSDTGADVQAVVPRAHGDPKARLNHLAENLATHGLLDAAVRVPGAVGTVHLVADLRARQVSVMTTVPAPTDRGNKARISWLARHFGANTPNDVLVESWPRNARQPLTATVAQLQHDRDLLLDPERRDILRFRLVRRVEMGRNRRDGGRSPGFVQSVTDLLDGFYATVLQEIVPWTPRPPQARLSGRPANLVDEPAGTEQQVDDSVDPTSGLAEDQVIAEQDLVEAPITV